MKNMYCIGYKKPNEYSTYIEYSGGDTEAEATEKVIQRAVEFHNKWNDVKITEQDIVIAKCDLSGDFETVLKDLQRG